MYGVLHKTDTWRIKTKFKYKDEYNTFNDTENTTGVHSSHIAISTI